MRKLDGRLFISERGEIVSNGRVNELWTVFAAVLPVFALMVTGVLLRRVQWLTASADESLLRICVQVLLPCLIFESVLGNTALQRRENLIWPLLTGSVMVLVGMGVAWIAARWAGLSQAAERRTFAMTCGLQNYGYIPIPLCLLLFDTGTLGVLLVHNVGVELILWTVGLAVLSGKGFLGGWRKIINAPLVALLLGMLLNAMGTSAIPEDLLRVGRVMMTAVHWLGQSGIPLSLLLVGAIVADDLMQMEGARSIRVAAVAIMVRFGILAPIFFLLARWLPYSMEMKRVMVLEGAMSAAVLPIALAKHFGGDPRTALQVVLGTSLAGLVAMPILIRLGGLVCGLW